MSQEGKHTVEIRPDYQGAIARGPLQNSYWHKGQYEWSTLVTVRWGEKELNYSVIAYSKDGEKKLSKEWTNRLTQTAARLFKTQGISPFKENDLTYHVDENVSDPDDSILVELDQDTIAAMEKDYHHCQKAEKSFRQAVDRLRSFARGPSEYGLNEATKMIFHLQWNIDRAYLGYEGSSYYEKLGRIRDYVPKLARRKNHNHYGFKLEQEIITESLAAFTPPKAWKDKPILLDPTKLGEPSVP